MAITRGRTFRDLTDELGDLVVTRNRQYGDSATTVVTLVDVLYPDGIQPESYSDALLLIRVLDKVCRIANRQRTGERCGESPWRDIAGYGILGVKGDER